MGREVLFYFTDEQTANCRAADAYTPQPAAAIARGMVTIISQETLYRCNYYG